jgi:hypothetical protein
VTGGVLKNNRGDFLRGDDGRIAWVRFGRRIHRPVLQRKSRIRLHWIRDAQIAKAAAVAASPRQRIQRPS